ncbi:MAG: serine hydrolase domain-containing protein [Glaciihabitans sp.]
MTTVGGDRALSTLLRFRLGRHHPVCAVATVREGIITTATVGATIERDFEIGSISKGITGLLYTDACERGDVTPQSTLGEFLPLAGCAAADLALGAISTHRSGLPRLPRSAHPLQRTIELWREGTNPYGETLDELLALARTVTLSSPRPRYSNIGFELLGHAIARAAGLSYTELLAERISGPLGMAGTYAPKDPTGLRPTALVGTNRSGRSVEPWTGEALAPAGGIRSTIGDLGALAGALADKSAPGIDALEPVATFGTIAMRIGAAWVTLEGRGAPVTWHNGGTGGFRSWLGVDREAQTAVVLLTATSRSVDGHGFRWLRELTESPARVRT